jgi:hypothetical protein
LCASQFVCVVSTHAGKPLALVTQHAPIVAGSGRLHGFDWQVAPIPWNVPWTAAHLVSEVGTHAWRPLGKVTQHAPASGSMELGIGPTSLKSSV